MFGKWKDFINDMNSKGVPVPMIRDGKSKRGSVSLTLVFVSFNVWLVSVIGKTSQALGGISPSETLSMFVVCSGLYFGRKFQKDKEGNITVEAKEKRE